ncbi:MAG: T9SS type A sorting domain-containing protein [Bacteroidetes bacterium]|nr:T9SS type A sorting domain-containing protein [Bacteroidota bacterium]
MNNAKGQNHRFGTFGDFTDLKSALSALSVSSAVQTICPYIGGTAVYKARALYAMYNPTALFDDMKICNAIGVYKTGKNNDIGKKLKDIFDAENNYLRGLKPNVANTIIKECDLKLFPNPAINQLNIRYKSSMDSKLQIVNILGIVVKEIYLPKESQQVSILLNEITTGIYSYRQICDKLILNSGKLVIVN